MLPLVNLLFISTSMLISTSQGLILKLIPPHSPESPFYNVSLSDRERARASFWSNRSFGPQEAVIRPPVELKQESLHAVKIGIGSFTDEKPTYRSYYLVMDTGSTLVWLQCKDCQTHKKCFKQKDPLFDSSKSKTYEALKCDAKRPIVCRPHKCDGKVCRYDIPYVDNSYSRGVIAHERFTFDAHPQGLVETRIRFGCGLDQKVTFARDDTRNQLAGILGLGWADDALHMQLNPNGKSKFSYCLQSEHNNQPHQTYLRFGADVQETSGFQETKLERYNQYLYSVTLKDITVGEKQLDLHPRRSQEKVILDSASSESSLMELIYQDLERELVNQLSKNPDLNRRRKEGNRLCYNRRRRVPAGNKYGGIPLIKFNFEDADFVMEPQQAFLAEKDEQRQQYFCLKMRPDRENSLGAYQQANHAMVFDLNHNKLYFKPETC